MDEDVILYGQGFEEIMDRLLESVPDHLDKREGSVIYVALAPAAMEIQLLYEELNLVTTEAYADTASLDYLIRRAAERGIAHKESTNAAVKGVFEPTTIDLIGYRFGLIDQDLNYVVTEKIGDGVYRLECETPGMDGNQSTGQLVPIYSDAIEDDQSSELTKAELSGILDAGAEEEDVDVFRQRYFDSIDNQAFGGNEKDYKAKLLEQDQIGAVKVYPVWNGGGSVKLVILNSAYAAPSDAIVAEMQEIIDPESSHGKGKGIAPIGHVVTVEAAESVPINIALEVIYAEGYTYESALPTMETATEEYFMDIRKNWGAYGSDVGSTVRISYIENKLLNLDAILDVQITTINESDKNLVLEPNQVPVVGAFINGTTGT